MKVLLILAVLLGVAYYYFFYQKAPDAPAAPVAGEVHASPPAAMPAATPLAADPSVSHSFDGVTALLRQDMNAIPAALDGPGHPPTNAQAIKRKVRPYLSLHPEYQTLAQVCDLIIRADAQRSTFQASCHAEQGRASFDNALNVDTSKHSAQGNGHVPTNLLLNTPPPDQGPAAIHQRVENSWSTYRGETASQVQRLLNSLEGRHL